MNVSRNKNESKSLYCEDVEHIRERKRLEVFNNMDSNWKSDIKIQLENEISRRVREALNTPPGERIRRQKEEALQRKKQSIQRDLNAHVKFDECDRLKITNKYLTTTSRERPNIEKECSIVPPETASNSEPEGNKFEYWLRNHHQPKQITSTGVILKLNNEDTEEDDRESDSLKTGWDAMENFGSLSLQEREILFSSFTKDGFREAIRTGKLPDGSKLEVLPNGQYKDRYGILRDKHGPFWPKNTGPLYPTPSHKRFNNTEIEPIVHPIFEKDRTEVSNNNSQFTATWRHLQIVYDSETSPRTTVLSSQPENICPSLKFESRFESGNLRQARRIGQTEYELVLQNDLYTSRHTQWFYFRIENMLKNITYKLVIINLLKPTSLYMEGMKMLLYSESCANKENKGWFRTGHHIRYSRNMTRLQCPLLNRDIPFYQLEFQIEFPSSHDVCYLAHCYPYNFTDLKNDISYFLSSSNSSVIKQEVLCETRIGNSCFLLTITDDEVPISDKYGAVITARVHPGETNASWMMKGLIQYLISDCVNAKELRKKIVFKIVPMLNPDGVIVGNYRCSLAGRDLNRNYRFPRSESFPTVFHTKQLVEKLKQSCQDVILYCDLHGHSRKHNVFMYGCDSQYQNAEDVNDITPVINLETIPLFVKDRLLPWLMQKQNPSAFSFAGCHFKIRRSKLSTGRVVMWNQYKINNSYTLETTFSGSDFDKRHFNTKDLEEIGMSLCKSVFAYLNILRDEKSRTAVELEVLKAVIKQMALKNKRTGSLIRKFLLQDYSEAESKENQEFLSNQSPSNHEKRSENFEKYGAIDGHLSLNSFIDNLNIEDIKKISDLKISLSDIEDSSSSDSDSESDPEEVVEEADMKIKKLKRKKKRAKLVTGNSTEKLLKKPTLKRISSKLLPVVSQSDAQGNINEQMKLSEKTISSYPFSSSKLITTKSPLFVSKFDGRTNGGIPCFTEERLFDRAKRKSLASLKQDLESSLKLRRNESIDLDSFLDTRNVAICTDINTVLQRFNSIRDQAVNDWNYGIDEPIRHDYTDPEDKQYPMPVKRLQRLRDMYGICQNSKIKDTRVFKVLMSNCSKVYITKGNPFKD